MRLLGRIIYILAWPFWFFYFKFSNHRCRVFLESDDKVLLVQGWLSSGKWTLPGGGVKRTETYTQALARELLEETGIELNEEEFVPMGDYTHNSKGLSYKIHLYQAQIKKDVKIVRQPIEIMDAQWASINELDKYDLDEDVLFGLEKYNKNLL